MGRGRGRGRGSEGRGRGSEGRGRGSEGRGREEVQLYWYNEDIIILCGIYKPSSSHH